MSVSQRIRITRQHRGLRVGHEYDETPGAAALLCDTMKVAERVGEKPKRKRSTRKKSTSRKRAT